MDDIPTWIAMTSSVAIAIVGAIITQIFFVPRLRKKITKQLKTTTDVKFNFEDSLGNGNFFND